MPLHIYPRALQYLEAVARLGSIQAASRALGIAASAIDRQIIGLEEECEVPLFDRHPRGMRLTAAGEAVVLMARRWRADQDRLSGELRQMRGMEHGTVRLAAMDSLSNSVLPRLMQAVSAAHPGINLSVDIVTPQQAARELDQATVDLALAFNLAADKTRHVLWSTPLPFGCVVGRGHDLWGARSVSLKDAAHHPIAAQSEILPVRAYLERRYGWLFNPVKPVLVTNSQQLLKQVLAQGELMAITSQMDVAAELLAGELCFVAIHDTGLKPQSLSLVVDARRPLSHAARKVGELQSSLLADTLARLQAIATHPAP
ncbi:HTH-type transcriptional activator CmpR [Aquimixticola soesokkakensis]|uniref:HTH-type transcriptional activator CmpR n=1 Tax=Aquimixticola soesokkakensis TaxID=1519096 RepID=A0A1Y5RYL3_9RHOB|nr:LysR family transcriptional regulator [Aquimixticola soesokkakensis]SLN27976.1 HTH-type transcriptional activator CmpR [Aquimixticola soesokkakensis]